MHLSLTIRATLIIIALLSVFWLPWTITLIALFIAGLIFPPAALALGVFADLLYYPGHGLPRGTFDGILLTLLATAVRHFVKTRIM